MLWQHETGPGYAGAAIVDGQVFLVDREASESDILRVFSLEDGEELWRLSYEAPGRLSYAGSRGVPTVTDECIYFIGGFGHVICVDRESQEELWRLSIPDDFEAELPRWGWAQGPILWEDLLIFAPLGEDCGLIAVDSASGDEIWRTDGIGNSHSSPALIELDGVAQIMMIASDADNGGKTVSYRPSDGSLLWESNLYFNRIPIPHPIKIDDNRLFITGGYTAGSLMVSVEPTGEGYRVEEMFTHSKGSQIHLPLLHEDHLYILVNENANNDRGRRREGGLMCLGLDGEEKWRTGDKPYFGRGHMILADGMLWIQDGHSGVLRVVEPNPEAFRLVAEFNVFSIDDTRDHQMWAPMALSDGRLVIRSQSEIKCLDLRARS